MDYLQQNVRQILEHFIGKAQQAFQGDLISIVLFGSGAEGKLRPSSDVNLIVVLKTFKQSQVKSIIESFRSGHAAIQLKAMFLLEDEIQAAVEAFTVKFADILHRHRVIFGNDPFQQVTISREVEINRLKQVLLNLTLRMRETFVAHGDHENQLTRIIADLAGPLRVCAATWMELHGEKDLSPKSALERVLQSFNVPEWKEVLPHLSQAREQGFLPPGVPPATLFYLIEIAQKMRMSLET